MNSPLFLVLRQNGSPAFATRLKLGELTIGRSTDNDISLALDTISRTHARLSVGEQGVLVTDLGSRNGTYVNRKRVTFAPVYPNDLIQFGVVQLVLSLDPSGAPGPDPEEETRDARSVEELAPRTPLPLSPAQTRVFDLMVHGWMEKQIAEQLNLSVHTVHNHTRRIYEAYGVSSKVELLLQVMPHLSHDSPEKF